MRVLSAAGRGVSAVGRGVAGSARVTGRLTGRSALATGRGTRWAYRKVADPGERGRTVRHRAFLGLIWIATVVMFFVGLGTAGMTYDLGRLGGGLSPFIGAVAGLPLFLISVGRPTLGWAISVTGAYVLAVALPFVNRDPWPWTVVHGLVMLTLLFAVCARERLDRGLGAWLITATLFLWGVPREQTAGWVVGVTAVAVFGALAGRLARTEVSLVRQERLTTEEKGRRMVLEERTRIARDLHDIVAHHMSLVVVQAETAPYRRPDLPDSARTELDAISASARAALAETRALLNVLRQDGHEVETAPQPGLELLPDLVDGARRAGVPITAEVGELGELRPGTSLAAYRVLQEALANAARHAPGAAVRLEVGRDAGTLALSVLNDTTGLPPRPVEETGTVGHGITGMRERVTAEGGTLRVGPTETGGFEVRATLPVEVR